jgi:hypothetical protein
MRIFELAGRALFVVAWLALLAGAACWALGPLPERAERSPSCR